MNILLVEDDELFGRALKTGLKQAGNAVEWVKDGKTALDSIVVGTYGAVALDINLPALSGFEVLKEIRKASDLPVIIMTARDGLDDRIDGLDLGADDYLVKPFDLKELLARLRAVTRRHNGRAQAIIRHLDIELNTGAKTVTRDGQWIRLTSREYQIFELLLERLGRIQSKADIEAHVYHWDHDIESNTVEAAIYSLRRKIGREIITTIRGVGYVIDPSAH